MRLSTHPATTWSRQGSCKLSLRKGAIFAPARSRISYIGETALNNSWTLTYQLLKLSRNGADFGMFEIVLMLAAIKVISAVLFCFDMLKVVNIFF